MIPIDFKKEKISFRDFIGYHRDVYIYLHNTFTEDTSVTILKEGFRFVKSLEYTTDHISNTNDAEIDYYKLKRKYYGKYTIVIHIGVELSKFYSSTHQKKVLNEQVFSEKSNELNEDDLNYHFLDKQFIKGFYIHETGEGVYNPFFNPHNKLDIFHDNIKKIEP